MNLNEVINGSPYTLAKQWVKENAPVEFLEAQVKIKEAKKALSKISGELEKKVFDQRDKWKAEFAESESDLDLDADSVDEAVSEFMGEVCAMIYPFDSALIYYNYDCYDSHWEIDEFWEPSTC